MAQQREYGAERIRGKGKAARRHHIMSEFHEEQDEIWKEIQDPEHEAYEDELA